MEAKLFEFCVSIGNNNLANFRPTTATNFDFISSQPGFVDGDFYFKLRVFTDTDVLPNPLHANYSLTVTTEVNPK